MKPITLILPYPVSANAYWATRIVKPRDGRAAMAMTYKHDICVRCGMISTLTNRSEVTT